MTTRNRCAAGLALLFLCVSAWADSLNHDDLLQLFADWRAFESPPLLDGAPDYTVEGFTAREPEFAALRKRLEKFEIGDWPVPQQVDWHLVRAEMNGYDFNRRVLMPWARDPAFYDTVWTYRSDVPAHEGPAQHALVELWTYEFPLSSAESERLTRELRVIPPLMQQARRNLTGNAHDLWVTGTKVMQEQVSKLDELRERPVVGFGVCPVSPLQLPRDATEVIVECARLGLPDTILSMAMAGGSAPVTLAGTLVVHNAEVLAGIALAQITESGSPVTYGSSTTAMDLRFASASVGSPECGMIGAGVACLARFYLLPSWVAGA